MLDVVDVVGGTVVVVVGGSVTGGGGGGVGAAVVVVVGRGRGRVVVVVDSVVVVGASVVGGTVVVVVGGIVVVVVVSGEASDTAIAGSVSPPVADRAKYPPAMTIAAAAASPPTTSRMSRRPPSSSSSSLRSLRLRRRLVRVPDRPNGSVSLVVRRRTSSSLVWPHSTSPRPAAPEAAAAPSAAVAGGDQSSHAPPGPAPVGGAQGSAGGTSPVGGASQGFAGGASVPASRAGCAPLVHGSVGPPQSPTAGACPDGQGSWALPQGSAGAAVGAVALPGGGLGRLPRRGWGWTGLPGERPAAGGRPDRREGGQVLEPGDAGEVGRRGVVCGGTRGRAQRGGAERAGAERTSATRQPGGSGPCVARRPGRGFVARPAVGGGRAGEREGIVVGLGEQRRAQRHGRGGIVLDEHGRVEPAAQHVDQQGDAGRPAGQHDGPDVGRDEAGVVDGRQHQVGDLGQGGLDRALERLAGDLDAAPCVGQRHLDHRTVVERQLLLRGPARRPEPPQGEHPGAVGGGDDRRDVADGALDERQHGSVEVDPAEIRERGRIADEVEGVGRATDERHVDARAAHVDHRHHHVVAQVALGGVAGDRGDRRRHERCTRTDRLLGRGGEHLLGAVGQQRVGDDDMGGRGAARCGTGDGLAEDGAGQPDGVDGVAVDVDRPPVAQAGEDVAGDERRFVDAAGVGPLADGRGAVVARQRDRGHAGRVVAERGTSRVAPRRIAATHVVAPRSIPRLYPIV